MLNFSLMIPCWQLQLLFRATTTARLLLMSKALGLNIISSNTFTWFQKHCGAPVIKEIWNEMNSIIVGILEKYEDLCLSVLLSKL